MTGQDWNNVVRDAAWTFAGTVAFPKLARRLRWSTRLGPRGLLLYIAFNTAVGMAIRTWALPYFRRLAEQRARDKGELRQQLGREPTDEELGAYRLARRRARR